MFQNHWHLGKGKKLKLVSTHTNQMEIRPSPTQLMALLLITNLATIIFSTKTLPCTVCGWSYLAPPAQPGTLQQTRVGCVKPYYKTVTFSHEESLKQCKVYSQSLIAMSLCRNFKALLHKCPLERAFTLFKKTLFSTTVISKWHHVTKN